MHKSGHIGNSGMFFGSQGLHRFHQLTEILIHSAFLIRKAEIVYGKIGVLLFASRIIQSGNGKGIHLGCQRVKFDILHCHCTIQIYIQCVIDEIQHKPDIQSLPLLKCHARLFLITDTGCGIVYLRRRIAP